MVEGQLGKHGEIAVNLIFSTQTDNHRELERTILVRAVLIILCLIVHPIEAKFVY